MDYHFLPDAIETLTNLFFQRSTSDSWLAMKTMEFYVSDLKMLEDISAVAREIENQHAFALLPIFRLYNSTAVDDLELYLSGKIYRL